MTTTLDARSTASLASSATFKTFAVVFAIATPIIYVACEMRNWPLFTYHPGTNRIDWLYTPAVRDQGPAMYWYGWSATTLIAAAVLGVLATMLPERLVRRIPLSLTWILPVASVPILIYALKFFWRW
jgi:DNA-binding transcriptional LysR family regulator